MKFWKFLIHLYIFKITTISTFPNNILSFLIKLISIFITESIQLPEQHLSRNFFQFLNWITQHPPCCSSLFLFYSKMSRYISYDTSHDRDTLSSRDSEKTSTGSTHTYIYIRYFSFIRNRLAQFLIVRVRVTLHRNNLQRLIFVPLSLSRVF